MVGRRTQRMAKHTCTSHVTRSKGKGRQFTRWKRNAVLTRACPEERVAKVYRCGRTMNVSKVVGMWWHEYANTNVNKKMCFTNEDDANADANVDAGK